MRSNSDHDDLKAIRPATLRKVIDYMKVELGLTVYGLHVVLPEGQGYHGCMDYTADEVIALRKFFMQGNELKEPEHN